jgi:hypothetical protein
MNVLDMMHNFLFQTLFDVAAFAPKNNSVSNILSLRALFGNKTTRRVIAHIRYAIPVRATTDKLCDRLIQQWPQLVKRDDANTGYITLKHPVFMLNYKLNDTVVEDCRFQTSVPTDLLEAVSISSNPFIVETFPAVDYAQKKIVGVDS